MRLIDADKFEAFCEKAPDDYWYSGDCVSAYMDGMTRVLEEIDRAPTVDAVPVVHAHWIHLSRTSVCSACKFETGRYGLPTKYCGGCGAKMDGQETDEVSWGGDAK